MEKKRERTVKQPCGSLHRTFLLSRFTFYNTRICVYAGVLKISINFRFFSCFFFCFKFFFLSSVSRFLRLSGYPRSSSIRTSAIDRLANERFEANRARRSIGQAKIFEGEKETEMGSDIERDGRERENRSIASYSFDIRFAR